MAERKTTPSASRCSRQRKSRRNEVAVFGMDFKATPIAVTSILLLGFSYGARTVTGACTLTPAEQSLD